MTAALFRLKALGLLSGALLLSGCPMDNSIFGSTAYSTPASLEIRETNPISHGYPLTFSASWSPDGKQLAIIATPNPNSLLPPRVYLIEAASGQITADWVFYNPASVLPEDIDIESFPPLHWLADGSLVIYQQAGRQLAIERLYQHLLRPGQPIKTRVIELPLRYNDPDFKAYSHPSFSPNQDQLVFFEHLSGPNDTPMFQLKHLDLNTQQLRNLGQPIQEFSYLPARPIWSRDQQSVYLSISRESTVPNSPEPYSYNSQTDLIKVRVDDGKSEVLYSALGDGYLSLKVSSDGQHLLADNLTNTARLKKSDFSDRAKHQSLIPENSNPESGFMQVHLDTAKRHMDYFSKELSLNNLSWLHGNRAMLVSSYSYEKLTSWKFWNFQTRRFEAEHPQPSPAGLNFGSMLGLSPPPAQKLAMSFYTPCCKLNQLETGVYLWDMEQNQFKRVGPELSRLVKDFPGIGLHERPSYDYSQVNKDFPAGLSYKPQGSISP